MSDREQVKELDRILEAWTNPGPHPEYHRREQARLRREWPTLAAALDAAATNPARSRRYRR